VPEYHASSERGPNIHCHHDTTTAAGEGTKLGSKKLALDAYCQSASSATGSAARRAIRSQTTLLWM